MCMTVQSKMTFIIGIIRPEQPEFSALELEVLL